MKAIASTFASSSSSASLPPRNPLLSILRSPTFWISRNATFGPEPLLWSFFYASPQPTEVVAHCDSKKGYLFGTKQA
jgi:hypothetical protein